METIETGVEIIAAERQRQLEGEGYSPGHDDRHDSGELNDAAICYAAVSAQQARGEIAHEWGPDFQRVSFPFPWEDSFWKPSADPIRNLAKAGALIAAEIDRLKRQEVKRAETGS